MLNYFSWLSDFAFDITWIITIEFTIPVVLYSQQLSHLL